MRSPKNLPDIHSGCYLKILQYNGIDVWPGMLQRKIVFVFTWAAHHFIASVSLSTDICHFQERQTFLRVLYKKPLKWSMVFCCLSCVLYFFLCMNFM